MFATTYKKERFRFDRFQLKLFRAYLFSSSEFPPFIMRFTQHNRVVPSSSPALPLVFAINERCAIHHEQRQSAVKAKIGLKLKFNISFTLVRGNARWRQPHKILLH
jgi:hypothetical protein